MIKGRGLANLLTPGRCGVPKVARWEANGVEEGYCKRQSGKWCVWTPATIGCEEVDGLQLKITVTVISVEGCEIRRPLYTGKAGQLNVGSRVPGVYPVIAA